MPWRGPSTVACYSFEVKDSPPEIMISIVKLCLRAPIGAAPGSRQRWVRQAVCLAGQLLDARCWPDLPHARLRHSWARSNELQRAPFRSPDEIRDSQLRDVRALLAHAETLVPYYRTLFRNLGVRSQEIRDWDDFARLPILTKDIIREEERTLIREDVPVEQVAEAFQRRLDGRAAEVFSQPRIHGEQRCRELSQP